MLSDPLKQHVVGETIWVGSRVSVNMDDSVGVSFVSLRE
jgi:hypothetical protein